MPFHINTIKNVAKNDEGEHTTIRINFIAPGQIVGRKEDIVSVSLLSNALMCNLKFFRSLKILMLPLYGL